MTSPTTVPVTDLEDFLNAARGVIANWDNGNLAGAVSNLQDALDELEAGHPQLLLSEMDLDLTHRQVYKAIWAARLETQFIRDNFILTEEAQDDGSIRRYYRITNQGYEAIRCHL